MTAGSAVARQTIETSERLGGEAGDFANVDHAFLYDRSRRLFRIGFNVSDRRLDSSYYDSAGVGSAARRASSRSRRARCRRRSWFALGRLLAIAGGEPVLRLVERLDVRVPDAAARDAELSENTLLDQTSRAAVAAADRLRAPARRAMGHFRVGLQPRRCTSQLPVPAFGVPGLGLQARPRRRPGRRPIRVGAGIDGRARGRVRRT